MPENVPEKFTKPYNAGAIEPAIYKKWEESGFFNPDHLPIRLDAQGKPVATEPYTIIMPPPNANGSLHAGHAVFVTIEDLFIRYKRMRGYKTLWLPGADHAGFETQVVYEKKLEKEGRTRFGMDPDILRKEILDFTVSNKVFMEGQLRQLGASCDWSREKFTLDPDIVNTVYDTFKKLYDEGLAYRGSKSINWCTKHQTSLSELETISEERVDPLYYMKYGPFVLATVRPETKFGDTAVAVNPNDPRYKEWVGKEIEFEGLLGPVKLKVIADDYVDMAFGTGVVKITPAHDPNDFEVAKRHNLPVVEVIDQYGKLNEKCGKYAGLKVEEARKVIAEDLEHAGLLEKVDREYKHNVKKCYKCERVLEPRVLPQWFISMKPLAEKAIAAIEADKIVFYPEHYKKIILHWLTNIEDWNVSRQIVWGIPIPVWYCLACGTPTVGPKVKSKWFLVRHGLTEWNKAGRLQGVQDSKLTEEGKEQIRAAAESLKDKHIDLIISSDLGRCKETSKIIAEATGAEIIYDSALRERNFGSFEGVVHADFEAEHGSIEKIRTYDQRYKDEETYQELEERVWEAFAKHKQQYKNKNVIIVSHGGSTRMLVKQIRKLTPEDAIRRGATKNGEVISVDILDTPCQKCGHDLFEQDSDTFDTWFSSGQWPFATLGFPDSPDFKTFYPTQVMETGGDLIFFWVSRMIMLGLYHTGEVPFSTVYLHGMVVAKDGKKMSKSKGNVISPLELSEKYGTDALRMGLVMGNTPGTPTALYEEKIKAYKLFSNKLWNVTRFILENAGEAKPDSPLTTKDTEYQTQFKAIIADITTDLENYRPYLAAEKLYHYVWDVFASNLLEESKPILKTGTPEEIASRKQLLLSLLTDSLKLLHPFMPFITEEIWGSLPGAKGLLMVEKWPL